MSISPAATFRTPSIQPITIRTIDQPIETRAAQCEGVSRVFAQNTNGLSFVRNVNIQQGRKTKLYLTPTGNVVVVNAKRDFTSFDGRKGETPYNGAEKVARCAEMFIREDGRLVPSGVPLLILKNIIVRPKVRGAPVPQLEREYTFLSKFQGNPHIAQVYGFWKYRASKAGSETSEIRSAMAMQRYQGSLLEEIDERALTLQQCDSYAHQLLQGLKAIHDQGLIHRDIKPENVLVDKDLLGVTQCKITDFGFSITTDEARADLKCPFGGTAIYFAPEYARLYEYSRVRSERNAPLTTHEQDDLYRDTITAQVDTWALGMMLYELYSSNGHVGDRSVVDGLFPREMERKKILKQRANLDQSFFRTPTDRDSSRMHLIFGLLRIDHTKRSTATQALSDFYRITQPLSRSVAMRRIAGINVQEFEEDGERSSTPGVVGMMPASAAVGCLLRRIETRTQEQALVFGSPLNNPVVRSGMDVSMTPVIVGASPVVARDTDTQFHPIQSPVENPSSLMKKMGSVPGTRTMTESPGLVSSQPNHAIQEGSPELGRGVVSSTPVVDGQSPVQDTNTSPTSLMPNTGQSPPQVARRMRKPVVTFLPTARPRR